MEALRYDITPTGLHYTLIHFDIPAVDPGTWTLECDGAVQRTLHLTLDEIKRRPSRTITVTMECASTAISNRLPIATAGRGPRAANRSARCGSGGWRYRWEATDPGPTVLSCRASDGAGNTQPIEQFWTARGMGNNMAQRVPVIVV